MPKSSKLPACVSPSTLESKRASGGEKAVAVLVASQQYSDSKSQFLLERFLQKGFRSVSDWLDVQGLLACARPDELRLRLVVGLGVA